MKKAAKGIIGLSAVLAVLGGGLAALKLTEPKENEENSSEVSEVSEAGEEVVLIRDNNITGTDPETGSDLEGVIKKVDVKNKTDELHVIQKTAKTEDSGATYTLEGYDDVKLNTSVIGTLANNANGMLSASTIGENSGDLSKFGLDNPEITVDITYETGSEVTLMIGNETPKGGEKYVMTSNSDTVYTVKDSTLENYSKTLFDFVDSTIVENPDQSDYPIVESLKIEREDIDYDILLKYDEKSGDEGYNGGTSATHVMVEPTDAYISVERSTDITNGIFGLYSKGIYSIHSTEADVAEAGLKEPFCTVTMDCDKDENDCVLYLSEPFIDEENTKCCYAMLKGGNVIYTVSADSAKWLTVQPIDIASRIFIASYVWNVTDLKVECDGEKSEFSVKRKDPDEEKDTLSAEDFVTTLNNAEFDTERYRQFYSFLISASAEDFALDVPIPDEEPLASLEYTDSYTGETTKIDFYDCSNLTAQAVINGKSKFIVAKSYVNTLIGNVKKLNTDEDFTTTWK